VWIGSMLSYFLVSLGGGISLRTPTNICSIIPTSDDYEPRTVSGMIDRGNRTTERKPPPSPSQIRCDLARI
jgi:hypothetical protein